MSIVLRNLLYLINDNIRPVSIGWEDGRIFEIDRIPDIRKAASLKAGGPGIRYICIHDEGLSLEFSSLMDSVNKSHS